MNYNNFFSNYIKEINDLLSKIDTKLINQTIGIIRKKISLKSTIYIAGNGGSSSIASHVSVDFTKAAKIKSLTFNNPNIITCFANDYGHDYWIKEAIKTYCAKEDLIILISSSGRSKNIINAAKYCKHKNIDLITLSGFSRNNALTKLGKINFHINSRKYNYIEMVHHIILVSIVDILTKKNN